MSLETLQAEVDALQANGNVDGLIKVIESCTNTSLLSQMDLSNWDFTNTDLQRIKAAIPPEFTESSSSSGSAPVPGPETIVKDEQGVVDPTNILDTASKLKEAGNSALQGKKLGVAASKYEKAIELLDKLDGSPVRKVDADRVIQLKTVLYSNLAQCFLKQELFRRAMNAATKCLELDEKNAKARYRRATARNALKMYAEALEDVTVLDSRGEVGNGPSADELAALRKTIEERKAALEKQMKEEGPDSDDETLELVRAKQRFDEVVEKYNLKDDETASEIADWMTRSNCGEQTTITLKDLEHKWGMDEEDGLAFLAWIDQGQKFKEEQAQASRNFTG